MDGPVLERANSASSFVPHVDFYQGGSPLWHTSGTYNPGDPAHCWMFVISASVSFRTCFCCCSCINGTNYYYCSIQSNNTPDKSCCSLVRNTCKNPKTIRTPRSEHATWKAWPREWNMNRTWSTPEMPTQAVALWCASQGIGGSWPLLYSPWTGWNPQ